MSRGRSWHTILGAAFVILGALLLLAAMGVISSGTAWGIFWAAVLILAGLLILSGHRSHYQGPSGGSPRAAVGEIRIGDTEWDLHDMDTGIGAGQLRLDLTKARIPLGETKIKINGGMGKIEVYLPAGLAVSAQSEVGAGSINILGQKGEGVGRQLSYTTPDYATAEKKVRIDLSLMVGEAVVSRVG